MADYRNSKDKNLKADLKFTRMQYLEVYDIKVATYKIIELLYRKNRILYIVYRQNTDTRHNRLMICCKL